MVVTIQDRRVASIPEKLGSKLHLESYCFVCKKSAVSKCSGCKLAYYCSTECQKQDWHRHKKEDKCVKVKKLYSSIDNARDKVAAAHGSLEAAAGEFDLEGSITEEYMSKLVELSSCVVGAAGHYPIMELRENVLANLVEMKRLTHVSQPDCMDHNIPITLLQLHRDDDVVSYIRYWLEWRSRPNLKDELVINSSYGEWPFPFERDSRFVTIMDEIKSFGTPVCHADMVNPSDFVMALLVVKIRNITVHDEGEIHEEQTRQAKDVMDHMDGMNPSILPALLNPDPLLLESFPQDFVEGSLSDAQRIVDQYLRLFKGEPGTFGTLKAMLVERFGSATPTYRYR